MLMKHDYLHHPMKRKKKLNLISCYLLLSLLVPPSIRAQSTLVQSAIGKSVQLRCSATVSFDTKIYWQRMNNNTALKFRQQQQTQGSTIQTSLYIKEIEKNDFGFYGCFAESKIGKTHAIIELREHRRSTNAQTVDKDELSTSRIQILKRNKISDQTTMLMKSNRASTCFSVFYLAIIFIQNIFYNLT